MKFINNGLKNLNNFKDIIQENPILYDKNLYSGLELGIPLSIFEYIFTYNHFNPTFLDNDLVDFSMKCPVELKIRDTDDAYRIDENIAANKTEIYFEKTNNGKLILRSAMESHLPKEVLVANKRGFSGPDASWFRGESIDYVKKKLLSGEHNLSDIVNQDTVVEMLDEHFSGKVNNRLAIWSLLYAEELIGQVFN